MVQEMGKAQVQAWLREQAERRSVLRLIVQAGERLVTDGLEETQTRLELALESVKRARRFHTMWSGE